MSNGLIEEAARQRAADLVRAAQEARAMRGGLDARRGGLVSSVRMLLGCWHRDVRPPGGEP